MGGGCVVCSWEGCDRWEEGAHCVVGRGVKVEGGM